MTEPTLNTQVLGDLIRHWVHYDNLATSLNKQTTNVRKLRDTYETRILGLLEESHMENAVIQIHGGKLSIAEERHPAPLSLTRLQELLHSYYATKKPGSVDETGEILKHLKAQRPVDITKRLKKQANLTVQPPLLS
jgi:hypothetical protein